MKRAFFTIKYMYSLERISLPLGAIFIIGAIILPSKYAFVSVIISSILLGVGPLLWISPMFIKSLFNRHLSMVPNWRKSYFVTTFCLILLCSLYISLSIIWSVSLSNNVLNMVLYEIFIFVFLFSTLTFLLFNIPFSNFLTSLLLWISIVFIGIRVFLYAREIVLNQSATNVSVLILMSLLVIAIWLRIYFFWVKQGSHKNNIKNNQNKEKYAEVFYKVINLFSGNKQLSSYHLLLGYSQLERKIFLIPFLVLLITYFANLQNANLLLFNVVAFYSMMVIFHTRELVARFRMLWLKLGGDRQQFLHLLNKEITRSLLFSMVILSVFGFVSSLIFDLSKTTIIIYMYLTFLVIPSGCYFVCYLRLNEGTKHTVAKYCGALYLILLFVSISYMLSIKDYSYVYGLAVISSVFGLASYSLLKKGFLTVDWLLTKPNFDIFSK